MHDDQHGTAVVALAGVFNALKVTGRRDVAKVKVVLNGAGAAGMAIAKLLHAAGFRRIVACDRQGAIWSGRDGLTDVKAELAKLTNPDGERGSLADVVPGADVLIGISSAGAFTPEMVRSMAPKAIVFGLANPIPEILPDIAKAAGAAVVATGRSDFPNQLNNALVYPGLFRGMLTKRVNKVTDAVKIAAAKALAGFIKKPTADRIVPTIFDKGLHEAMAKSVR
jgi:malate dehydrogenase (oxaloacetate-decarboxylating)